MGNRPSAGQHGLYVVSRDHEGSPLGKDDARLVLLGQTSHAYESLVESFDQQHVVQLAQLSFSHATHDLASGALHAFGSNLCVDA